MFWKLERIILKSRLKKIEEAILAKPKEAVTVLEILLTSEEPKEKPRLQN